ncbi:mitochondrial protein [Punctularia strigosozonata HHB-11173 SS5]|uniref:mitochondrial protein n=1 Tax=Punctularia strigosozonata (strain HHB-11173) TaxID=741275 RepID=UPI0004417875|nr:mitochondrial protein [Punctularia strigosozonata HHB-11173 SS5]EIN09167.1 mitochondrial protein [Punctularia strigosozonata HHB-11173 SS5]
MDDEPVSAPPLRPPLQSSKVPRENEPDEYELVRKWHEERLQRKLRGEYESAVMHLADVVNNSLERPARIASVRVVGATNTRPAFLSSLVAPYLSPTPTSLRSVLDATRGMSHILTETGLFRTLDARLEKSRSPFARDQDVDVVIGVRERGRFWANTSTEVGNGEGSASATVRINNAFGGAEAVQASFATGTKTKRSFNASLSAPLSSDLKTRGELSAFLSERDHSSFASCFEGLRGAKAVVRTTRWGGLHELAYEAVLRHIGSLTPTASISKRQSAGHTFKSAVSHSYTLDTRDSPIQGTRGALLKLSQELAGVGGGDASFYKVHGEASVTRPLFPGTWISLGARSGAMWALGGRPTLFSDRFQLGGPTSLRMFRQNSMGPRDDDDSLGGDIYYSAGLSLISDIPRKAHWPVKTHVFVNAGRLDTMSQEKTFVENVTDVLSKPSISAGVGLIYRFDPIRVEVNFGVPLVASASDGARKGVQVGMGIEFL